MVIDKQMSKRGILILTSQFPPFIECWNSNEWIDITWKYPHMIFANFVNMYFLHVAESTVLFDDII